MGKLPLVSIVLPTYNGTKYIAESIDSVLAQTYQNWELIIVDDCSKDDTLKIAQSYAKTDDRIRVIHNKVNQKVSGSLNIGFREARGEYLTWTSDDNRYLPKALEKMLDILLQKNAKMVSADCYIIDGKGNRTGRWTSYDESTMLLCNTVAACFMYTREVLNKVGEYDTVFLCVQDYDYWLRILQQFGHIEHLPELLYEYRVHTENLSARKFKEANYERLTLLDKHLDEIFKRFREDKHLLAHCYYTYAINGGDMTNLQKRFFTLVPELQYEKTCISNNDKFIVFGAGDYGERTLKILGNKCLCFVDNDKTKWGQCKEGLPIFSFKEAVQMYPDAEIIVAVGRNYVFEIIEQILLNGISGYMTYMMTIERIVE